VANRVRGPRKAAAARKGHRKTSKRKSHAGVLLAARKRWGKGPIKRKRK
jgi:hypothetical protein